MLIFCQHRGGGRWIEQAGIQHAGDNPDFEERMHAPHSDRLERAAGEAGYPSRHDSALRVYLKIGIHDEMKNAGLPERERNPGEFRQI